MSDSEVLNQWQVLPHLSMVHEHLDPRPQGHSHNEERFDYMMVAPILPRIGGASGLEHCDISVGVDTVSESLFLAAPEIVTYSASADA